MWDKFEPVPGYVCVCVCVYVPLNVCSHQSDKLISVYCIAYKNTQVSTK